MALSSRESESRTTCCFKRKRKRQKKKSQSTDEALEVLDVTEGNKERQNRPSAIFISIPNRDDSKIKIVSCLSRDRSSSVVPRPQTNKFSQTNTKKRGNQFYKGMRNALMSCYKTGVSCSMNSLSDCDETIPYLPVSVGTPNELEENRTLIDLPRLSQMPSMLDEISVVDDRGAFFSDWPKSNSNGTQERAFPIGPRDRTSPKHDGKLFDIWSDVSAEPPTLIKTWEPSKIFSQSGSTSAKSQNANDENTSLNQPIPQGKIVKSSASYPGILKNSMNSIANSVKSASQINFAAVGSPTQPVYNINDVKTKSPYRLARSAPPGTVYSFRPRRKRKHSSSLESDWSSRAASRKKGSRKSDKGEKRRKVRVYKILKEKKHVQIVLPGDSDNLTDGSSTTPLSRRGSEGTGVTLRQASRSIMVPHEDAVPYPFVSESDKTTTEPQVVLKATGGKSDSDEYEYVYEYETESDDSDVSEETSVDEESSEYDSDVTSESEEEEEETTEEEEEEEEETGSEDYYDSDEVYEEEPEYYEEYYFEEPDYMEEEEVGECGTDCTGNRRSSVSSYGSRSMEEQECTPGCSGKRRSPVEKECPPGCTAKRRSSVGSYRTMAMDNQERMYQSNDNSAAQAKCIQCEVAKALSSMQRPTRNGSGWGMSSGMGTSGMDILSKCAPCFQALGTMMQGGGGGMGGFGYGSQQMNGGSPADYGAPSPQQQQLQQQQQQQQQQPCYGYQGGYSAPYNKPSPQPPPPPPHAPSYGAQPPPPYSAQSAHYNAPPPQAPPPANGNVCLCPENESGQNNDQPGIVILQATNDNCACTPTPIRCSKLLCIQ